MKQKHSLGFMTAYCYLRAEVKRQEEKGEDSTFENLADSLADIYAGEDTPAIEATRKAIAEQAKEDYKDWLASLDPSDPKARGKAMSEETAKGLPIVLAKMGMTREAFDALDKMSAERKKILGKAKIVGSFS